MPLVIGDGVEFPARSKTQQRVIVSARKLFGEHGVSGTSLQMIADDLGVTKAAVYHQFPSKEEIILASTEEPLRRLEAAVAAAEAEPTHLQALEVLVPRLVDQAIEERAIVNQLQSDPAMRRVLAKFGPPRELLDRLYRCLTDDDSGAEARIRAAMVMTAIGSTSVHPLVIDVDDETLRAHILELAYGILGVSSATVTSARWRLSRSRPGKRPGGTAKGPLLNR